MNYFKVAGPFLAAASIFGAGLIGFSGCAGNSEITPVLPDYQVLRTPPIEVTIDQLYQEYITDEAAAIAKYEGRRLLFSNVLVEEINNVHVDPETGNVRDIYIVNNFVEFRAKFWTDVAFIREGFVVDIVGEPRGIFGIKENYLVVGDCRIFIIEGDLDFDFGLVPDY
jgi:hypothetical protein